MEVTNVPAKQLSYLRTLGRLYRLVSKRIASSRSKRVVVLMYHSIGSTKYAMKPTDFAAQMRFLSNYANVIDFESLLTGEWRRCERRLVCAITFDDGYAGVYDEAFPLLLRYHFPAVVYITTDAIGINENRRSDDYMPLLPGERMLSWSQCRELRAQGVMIGSHLCRHLDLATLSPVLAAGELRGSKAVIEHQLGTPCKHFAFPWGRYTRRALNLVRECGYETAATVIHRPVTERLDSLRIPRMNVGPGYTIEDFRAVLEGDWDYIGIIQGFKRPRVRILPEMRSVA